MREAYYSPEYSGQRRSSTVKQKLNRLLAFLGLCVIIAVAVATYVLLNRLSDQVLTVIATIGCAAGVALPGTLLAVMVLLNRVQADARRRAETQTQRPQVTQPMIIPPVQFPPQLREQERPPATWEQAPQRRRFVVVGDESDGWGE